MPLALMKGVHEPNENDDFVICQICGARGLDLRKHIRRRHDLNEVVYENRYPEHGLIARTLRDLFVRKRGSRSGRTGRLTSIGEILPDAVCDLVAEPESQEKSTTHIVNR